MAFLADNSVPGAQGNNIPRHIAIIMDGNGRWARKRLKNRINGHRKGISVVLDVVRRCSDIGVEYLTLYTFSVENWSRPAIEVRLLMNLLERHLKAEARSLVENNIRFKAIGRIHDLPASVKGIVSSLEAQTARSTGMTLHLALSYSGRDDILSAARTLAKRAAAGQLKHEDITEEMFSSCLYTSGAPDPDLLIRTGGEKRISNFLLWQLAYTEIYVTDVLWPDFTSEHLAEAIRDYQRRERRFGQVKEENAVAAG